MRSRLFAAVSLVSLCALSRADEQPGYQPGWSGEPQVEACATEPFSSSAEPFRACLVAESPNADLVTSDQGFFVAHRENLLTICHTYGTLPPDVSIQGTTTFSAGTYESDIIESQARPSECGSESLCYIGSYFDAYGEDSGGVFIQNRLDIRSHWAQMQIRPPGGGTPSVAGAAFEASDSPDIMNLTYEAEVVFMNPFNPVTTDTEPAAGYEARIVYGVVGQTDPFYEFYVSPWAEVNGSGEVSIDVGSGGEVLEATDIVWVQPSYIALIADGGAAGYAENRLKIEGMSSFRGALTIVARDPEGRPLPGVNLDLRGAASGNKSTDVNGEAEFEINGGGPDAQTVDVTVPPGFVLGSSVSQIVDNARPTDIHVESPAYYMADFALSEDARHYRNGGEIFDDFVLRVYQDGTLVEEVLGLPAKCDSRMTESERAAGVINAHRYAATPDAATRTYHHDVIWTNDLNDEVSLALTPASPQRIRESRAPVLGRPFRVHFVGFDSGSDTTIGAKGIYGSWVRPPAMGKAQDFYRLICPVDVAYSVGLDIRASFTSRASIVSSTRVYGYFDDLERHRRTLRPRPDLIVGVTAPGIFGADGLSEDNYPNVVLLDGVVLKPHYLLHEYLHAVADLPDNYDYETGANNRGASANGVDPRTGGRVYNTPGAAKPGFQTVMYDRGSNPWMTEDDYRTLLDVSTVVISGAEDGEPAFHENAGHPGESEERGRSQEVLLVGAKVNSRQVGPSFVYSLAEAGPFFVDRDEPDIPQVTPVAEMAIIARLSNGQSAGVLEWVDRLGQPDPEGDGNPAASPLFKFPYDPAVDSVTFETLNPVGGTETIGTVVFSPNAPTVSVESPVPGARLGGVETVVFHADDVDAGERLWAWIHLSDDGGATWRPAANWYDISPGRNEFELACDMLPSMSGAQLRVLVSDGTRSARADTGPFDLSGYSTTPEAGAVPPWVEMTVQTGAYCVAAAVPANTGGDGLETTLRRGALPAWLTCLNGDTRTIGSEGRQPYYFRCDTSTTGVFTTDVDFDTNDPDTPLLSVPFTLTVTDEPAPPVVLEVASSPPVIGGDTPGANESGRSGVDGNGIGLGPGFHLLSRTTSGPVRFQVREACRRTGLEGAVLIHHAGTGAPLDNLALTTGVEPGLYEAEWDIARTVFGTPLGVEGLLWDPATGLSSVGGANPLGWDIEMTVMRANTAPVIAQPADDLDAVVIFPHVLEIPIAATDEQGDEIHFAVEHSPGIDVILDEAGGRLLVTWLLDQPHDPLPTITLYATDRWGAMCGRLITVSVFWPSTPYAFLAGHDSVWLDENPMPLAIGAGGVADRPRHVTVDWRASGAAEWTNLGQPTFDRFDQGLQLWVADTVWPWPDPGADIFELRLTLTAFDGTIDPNPPSYFFERPRDGGRVTLVEAPASVMAGSRVTVRVHVQNLSSQRWSTASGYGLRAVDGIDALTGLDDFELGGLTQIERGASRVIEIEALAPSQPGAYRTAWVMERDGAPFGESGEATVQVTPGAGDAAGRQALVDVLLGRATGQGVSPGLLDLNADGLLDVNDLVELVRRLEIDLWS